MAKKDKKGSFGGARLPLATSYVYPRNRNRLLLAGAGVAALVAGLLVGDFLWGRSTVLSSGPVASAHAGLEGYCANCHTRFSIGDFGADPLKCAACHEPASEPIGVHTFDAHYVYRSADAARAFRRDGESPCAACHPEHRGRDAPLTSVSDAQCASCHGFGSFNDGHPQFAVLADGEADAGALSFAHIRHIKEVRDRDRLDDVEQACLACHTPRESGGGFEPIDFNASCGACHLGGGVRSANLPIRPGGSALVTESDGGVELALGVETLETIRARRGPGEQWALSEYPGDFRVTGSRVMKNEIVHRDPWVLHNLRQIRAAIYPGAGLADLLTASPRVAADETRVLYDEAVAALRAQIAALQGRPEAWVQEELVRLAAALADVERRLADAATALDDSRFSLAGRRDPRLSDDQVGELLDLADRLATPCRQCHNVADASIARVRQDQRELRRAQFDHGAHVLQRRCLDCHASIPVFDYLGDVSAVPPELDNASIVNLPPIETCQTCHAPATVSNACTTCHLFHPRRADVPRLQLYVP